MYVDQTLFVKRSVFLDLVRFFSDLKITVSRSKLKKIIEFSHNLTMVKTLSVFLKESLLSIGLVVLYICESRCNPYNTKMGNLFSKLLVKNFISIKLLLLPDEMRMRIQALPVMRILGFVI